MASGSCRAELLDVLAGRRFCLSIPTRTPRRDQDTWLLLPTIEAALSELGAGGAGGVVALSRGPRGSDDHDDDVALAGACPEQTTITSTVESITNGALTVLAPTVVVTGVTLTGPALGAVVLDGGTWS
ncbi:MAG: hypothetical protein H6674_11225 [Dehalococcoidia bacterium]|nr:hypothetical protein [Dehalococcoidia bacterium]